MITLSKKDSIPEGLDADAERRRLIDEISAATNRQTAVLTTDKFSNDDVHLKLQKVLFDRFGLLYERKRGEFSDGVLANYIDRTQVLDRNVFIRVMLIVYGRLREATKKRIFASHNLTDEELLDQKQLERFSIGYRIFNALAPRNTNSPRKFRDVLAKVYIGVSLVEAGGLSIARVQSDVSAAWERLLLDVSKIHRRYSSNVIDRDTGQQRIAFSPEKWMSSSDFEKDVVAFVTRRAGEQPPWSSTSSDIT